MADSRPIGVFDSGLGGLTVMKEIVKLLPYENIVYFGDTGRVPYGTRSNQIIEKYARQDEKLLLKNDVKLIVAACGTVSSVAVNAGNSLPVPYFEVVSFAAKRAAKVTKNKKIGIIGTSATINSGAHKRQILDILPDAQVISNSCTIFVPLVEAGWISKNDPIVYKTAERYLQPMLDAGVDTLILGCTHYPILADVIGDIMGKNVTLINAGTEVAVAIAEFIHKNKLENNSGGNSHRFIVSDKTSMFSNIASMLLGNEIDERSVEWVEIDKL